MRYSNPRLPRQDAAGLQAGEGREFLRLLLIVAALMLAIVLAFDRLSAWLAPRLPFAWEMQIAESLHLDTLPVKVAGGGSSRRDKTTEAVERALQARVERIRRTLAVPPDIVLSAHYVDSPTVNAVATLGGHITVFRGLLDKLEYEEELDAVLAHEIGHVTERHLVRHLSRGVTTAVALSLVGIRSPTLSRWLIGDAQQLQQLAYTRAAEREADAVAVAACNRLHGHTGGLSRLFERFEALRHAKGERPGQDIEFLQSHPLPEKRRDSASHASQSAAAPLTPLAVELKPAKAAKGKPGA